MEFSEKLQELRKSRGLTQEELAEALFVSRTAISKWESGRGYPNMDSIKEIAKYFSVTIDDLLSGEKVISIAEQENKSNIQSICDLLTGILDVFSFTLVVLPLYPNMEKEYVSSVNLFFYTETTLLNRVVYWILFMALVVVGTVKILLTQWKAVGWQNILTAGSMGISILTILFLALTRQAYACTLAFLLFVVKGILFLKISCLKKKPTI